jgi:hypothetical protein
LDTPGSEPEMRPKIAMKIQKQFALTCPECLTVYQLLEKHSFQAKQIHQQELKSCEKNCLTE